MTQGHLTRLHLKASPHHASDGVRQAPESGADLGLKEDSLKIAFRPTPAITAAATRTSPQDLPPPNVQVQSTGLKEDLLNQFV